jgi:hypothetical protein
MRHDALFGSRPLLATTDILTMANLNLPVVVFLLVLLTQIVAWVGKTALQELASSSPAPRRPRSASARRSSRTRPSWPRPAARTSSPSGPSSSARLTRGLPTSRRRVRAAEEIEGGADGRQHALVGALVVRDQVLDPHLGGHDRRLVLPRLVVPPRARVLRPGRLGARTRFLAPRLPWRAEG